MKRLWGRVGAGCVVVLAFACVTSGCGSDNESSDELVAMRFQGTLDFRLDKNDGPEDILHLDEGELIDQDGSGTRTSSTYDGGRPFRVPPGDLDRLKDILPQLDLDDLQTRFGPKDGDDSTTTFTYGGQTIKLGDEIDGAGHGEADEQADRFHEAASIINHAGNEALPPRIKNIDKRVNRELKPLRRKLKVAPPPSCAQAQALVERNPGLSPQVKDRIYSRVPRPQQPCP